MKRFLIPAFMFLTACGGGDATHTPEVSTKASEALVSNRIAIPAPVRQNLGITFVAVEYRTVQGVVRVPGHFELDADAQQTYALPRAGAIEVLVRPYTAVTVGQPLYRITGQSWVQQRSQWDEAETASGEAATARRDLLRATVAQMAGLTLDDERLPALRRSPSLTVHARAAGVITPQLAVSGSFHEAGSAIVVTSDPTRLRFRATALQGDLSKLREGGACAIVPMSDSHRDRLPARLALGLEADPIARTVDVLAWPSADARPAWVRPGIAALLEIHTSGSADEELAIPLAATIRDGVTPVLFRRDPANPDQVIRVDADLGANDGVWVQVLSGLTEGDQVVVGGIYPLLLTGGGKAGKAGHFHADGTFHEGKD